MIVLTLAGTSRLFAQQPLPPAPGVPPRPKPNFTLPLFLRPTPQDFAKARGYLPNPLAPYLPTQAQPVDFSNSSQFASLIRGGKLYLSLNKAVLLALQNNYDIAMQRLNLDVADTDLLRARAGQTLRGISTSLVTNTQGGTISTVSSVGGGPGNGTTSSGVAGTGPGGLALSTNGAGPAPEDRDPALAGNIELNRARLPQQNTLLSGGLAAISQNTDTYDFTYNQGFAIGTQMQAAFQNTRLTSDNPFDFFSPTLSSTFTVSLTQHLLQGFGPGINDRLIVQAKNDRGISDSLFRQQLLYTINQVEDIYWGLVSAYEDVQSKQRALDQSAALEKDDETQLQAGAIAPLDVVDAQSQVAADQQALLSAQNTLEYQEMAMKQAIARNLDDPALADATVVPTDQVSLAETTEEHMPVNRLVHAADVNNPAVEQAILTLKNDAITLRGTKNALLPVLDVEAFYGASALGGAVSPYCNNQLLQRFGGSCSALTAAGYGTVFQNLFDSSGPNKGVEFNFTIPIRNRAAQADHARSQIEYERAEMALQQLYMQIRMNVTSQHYALANDRASVLSATANRNYSQQSLDAEMKKLHVGASTTANVLQQQRNLAAAEAQLIAARARYATDRAGLEETLGSALDHYGVSIVDAATGQIHAAHDIPRVEPAKRASEIPPLSQLQETP